MGLPYYRILLCADNNWQPDICFFNKLNGSQVKKESNCIDILLLAVTEFNNLRALNNPVQ